MGGAWHKRGLVQEERETKAAKSRKFSLIEPKARGLIVPSDPISEGRSPIA
jgi:hypothetical protein